MAHRTAHPIITPAGSIPPELDGYARIAGVDEVGRGPLAGPVVAAAVVFPLETEVPGVADSKQLSDPQRRSAFPHIFRAAIAVGVGVVDPEEIDRMNILQATFEAMRLALVQVRADAVIVDGRLRIPGVERPQLARPGADASVLAVAAASIIAKVIRDDIMIDAHTKYPEYGFARHKGYATSAHFAALDRHGPSPLHRQSFLVRWRERRAQAVLEL